jgi:predicted PurR-regulated permease PerM
MSVLLTVLSILAVLVLFGALVFYLVKIIQALESIGGATPRGYSSQSSYLSKISFGVRAIEQQTGHLGPEVTRLNESLTQAAEGLGSIDSHLERTIEAAGRQEGGR